MFLIWPCSCLCLIHWTQVSIWEWRYSWSSANRWLFYRLHMCLISEVWGYFVSTTTYMFADIITFLITMTTHEAVSLWFHTEYTLIKQIYCYTVANFSCKTRNEIEHMTWYIKKKKRKTHKVYITLSVREPSYLGLIQYHGCWCPDSLRCQDISSHDIDYTE